MPKTKWSHLDTDDERLPEGMTREKYDADTQTYTYRDKDGSIWEGPAGNRYGELRCISSTAPHRPPDPGVAGEQPSRHDSHHSNDNDPEELFFNCVTEPKKARLHHSEQHAGVGVGGSKPLPSLPPDVDNEKEDNVHQQQQQELKRSGTLGSKIARAFSRRAAAGGGGRSRESTGNSRLEDHGVHATEMEKSGSSKWSGWWPGQEKPKPRAKSMSDAVGGGGTEGKSATRRGTATATTFDEILDGR
ncbi:hypothetical protein B0H66DRAFT_554975 [Apodospora peruviana]|uniref:Uncharacterized protein n=1 Tax=Apodospora peruviana TaxID=516989 RepID=A0AAE0ICR5_9PEZI|nr:hypothetical protein B0H66DRAFT_554975 [Apodospora peruviana]